MVHELDVLKAAMSRNMGVLLHDPSVDGAADALDSMMATAHNGALFGALCGTLATVAADALKEMRASFPPGPARDAPFALVPPPADATLAEQTAVQLVTATANDDHDMVIALMRAVLSWTEEAALAKFASHLAFHARMMHLSVCDDFARDSGGAP